MGAGVTIVWVACVTLDREGVSKQEEKKNFGLRKIVWLKEKG